jgi:hypothetical protein
MPVGVGGPYAKIRLFLKKIFNKQLKKIEFFLKKGGVDHNNRESLKK